MNEKILGTVEELKRKAKIAELREKLINAKNAALVWCDENKEFVAVTAIPTAVMVCSKIFKTVKRDRTIRKEQELKDLYVYDRSQGHYWQLKRQLKPSEWQMVELRKLNGEKLGQILDSMKVLKK